MSIAGQGLYCAFCGSLLDGGGRFCGTCGKPSDAGQHQYPPGGPTNPRTEPLHPGSTCQPGKELGQPAQRWDGRRWLESDSNVADAPGQQEGGRERGLSDATRSSGAENSSDQNVVAGKGELRKAVDSALSMPKWILAIFVSVFLVVFAVIIVNVVSPQTSGGGPSGGQDDTYLALLRNSGISYTNQAATIEVAHQICTYFDHGNSFVAVLNEVSTTYPGLTDYEDGVVIGAAVKTYCSYNRSSIPGQ